MKTYTLNNGYEMPVIGLGTFTLTPKEAEFAVEQALRCGYRHIDTANVYVNEKAVGRGIKKSGVPREEIFLETKLWCTLYHDENAVDKTLERLGVDYVDLMILHQPSPDYLEGYKLLEKGVREGKIRSIGVSNFYQEDLDNLLAHCEIKPVINQIETHPYCDHIEYSKYMKERGILLQSWSPLGHGDANLLNNEVICQIAKKYNKSSAQILLRWQLELGYQIIPGSKNKDHIQSNFDIFDFSLSKEDMDLIKTLNKDKLYYPQTKEGLIDSGNWAPDFDGQE